MALNAVGAHRRGGRQTAKDASLPPPVGGVNVQAPFRGMRPDECLYAYNIVASERSMETRKGSEEWNNGFTGSGKTIIPYKSTDGSDKLFVCADDGIYESTSQGDGTASIVFSFISTGPTAGKGNFIQFTNDAGEAFILYADSANGLIMYTVSTDTWAAVTSITGLVETNIRYVSQHKQRIWFALEGTNIGYYLPLGAITGAATAFYFGGLAPKGGEIVSYHNWTIDGGDGVDDFFIVVLRGGDILAFKGADPSSANTWALQGKWNVGNIPEGRRIGTQYGGEVFLLTLYGVITISALFRGVDITDFKQNITAKITAALRARMATELNSDRWELSYFGQEGLLIINSPVRPGSTDQYLQYVFNFTTQAWSFWRGLNMVTLQPWNQALYFTDDTGILWHLTDGRDNRLIADTDASEAVEIDFSLLMSYQKYEHAGHKIANFLRPVFQGPGIVAYNAKIVYDYDLNEINPSSAASPAGQSLWDTALWDTGVWASAQSIQTRTVGAGGLGRAMAVAIRGSAAFQTRLIEIDLSWQQGSFL